MKLCEERRSHKQFHLLTSTSAALLMTAEMKQIFGRCNRVAKNEKKICFKLDSKIFLLLHVYLLNKKELHTDALNKKYNISEQQVLFIRVIPKLLSFSFGFRLCYHSLQNENFMFSTSCAVMASSTQFVGAATSPETISSVVFTVKILIFTFTDRIISHSYNY